MKCVRIYCESHEKFTILVEGKIKFLEKYKRPVEIVSRRNSFFSVEQKMFSEWQKSTLSDIYFCMKCVRFFSETQYLLTYPKFMGDSKSKILYFWNAQGII